MSSHVETEQLCVINNRVRLIWSQTTLTFFGQTITQRFTCGKNAYIYAPTLRPGDSWSFTCKSQGGSVVQHLKAVGYTTINVGGTNVRCLHIVIPSRIGGSDSGSSRQDIWIAATSHPQEIRNKSVINAKQGAFSYNENVTLQLKSLRPRASSGN